MSSNPIGSADPIDFYLNSQNLDLAMNGTGLLWTDRFGIERISWAGVTKKFDDIEQELSGPEGASRIGASIYQTQADKNAEFVSVLDKGAKADSTNGLNGTDSTIGFLDAVTECRTTGKALIIPKNKAGYRLTQPVDFREINVLDNNATLYINHPGIGVIFGGNGSNPNNPRQSFGTITRVTGTAGIDTPDMRGIGIKGQHIYIERCEYVQLYANDALPNKSRDYSCAYSDIHLKKADTLQLFGEGNGWINEINFYLNRTNKILFVEGQYHHNHNKFHNGAMEGPGIIDLPVGSNNKFIGFRFERNGTIPTDTLTINFGPVTWDNSVLASWVSSGGYSNSPYNPNDLVTVNDEGIGNSVLSTQDLESDEKTIFDLSSSTPFLSSINAGLTGTLNQNTDIQGVRFVKSLTKGKFRCLTSWGSMYTDGRIFAFRNGDKLGFISDQAMFRPLIYLYDANGNAIVNEPTEDVLNLAGKVWSNGSYTISANSNRFFCLFKKSDQIKYFRIALSFGNATAGLEFEYARLTMRMPKNFTVAPRKGFDITVPSRKATLPYFNSSDVNMANIGEGVLCLKTDLSEIKINLIRQRYSVSNITGNVLSILGTPTQYFDVASCFVVYTDSTGANVQVPVSAVGTNSITLSATPPAEITIGSSIDFIISKTKTLL